MTTAIESANPSGTRQVWISQQCKISADSGFFRVLPAFIILPSNLSSALNQSKSEQIRPKSTYGHQKTLLLSGSTPASGVASRALAGSTSPSPSASRSTRTMNASLGRAAEIKINRPQKTLMNKTNNMESRRQFCPQRLAKPCAFSLRSSRLGGKKVGPPKCLTRPTWLAH